jgi:hypothetical protein
MFLPPKTGTQTARVFLKNIGWHVIPPEHNYPETNLAKYPNLSTYKHYVFLRNPLDRFVSTIVFLKQHENTIGHFKKVIDANQIGTTVEALTYDQFVDYFSQFNAKFPIMLEPQSRWATLPGTEVLDFDNYEAEIRRISGDYTNPLVVQNKSTDFGRSVVTQKVIDFVKQHYAVDYALAKDRLGKEY